MLRKLLAHRWMRVGIAVCLGVALLGGWVAWKMGVDLASLKEGWKLTVAYLEQNPGALFLALVILPGLPVPTSVLLVTAGVVWKDRPVMACSLCLLALALNLSWTYWLAAFPARRLVEKMLASSSIQIPELPRGDHLKLILVMRLTPGIPLFLQNYLLGFLRAPFLLYLPVSLLCTGIIGIGFILSAAGVADGKQKWAVAGGLLIVLGMVLTHLIRGWLKRKRAVSGFEKLEWRASGAAESVRRGPWEADEVRIASPHHHFMGSDGFRRSMLEAARRWSLAAKVD